MEDRLHLAQAVTATIGSSDDPLGVVLDAYARRLGAERWVTAFRRADGWTMRASEPSPRDRALARLIPNLVDGADVPAGSVDPGADVPEDLRAAGVHRLVRMTSAEPQPQAVLLYENPSPARLERLSQDSGELLLLTRLLPSLWRGGDLRLVARAAALLSGVGGDIEANAAAFAEALGASAIVVLERDHPTRVWASWSTGEGWKSGQAWLDEDEREPARLVASAARAAGVDGERVWTVVGSSRRVGFDLRRILTDEALAVVASLIEAPLLPAAREDVAAAVMNERLAIGTVLHGAVTQDITNVALQLQLAENALTEHPERARHAIAAARLSALAALDQTRSIVLELQAPPEPEIQQPRDLAEAVERFVRDYAAQWELDVRFERGADPGPVPAERVSLVFAFVQEGLTNVRRHAGTRSATVELQRRHEGLVVAVRDEGIGMPSGTAARPGRGLGLLRARAAAAGARLRISSTPARGTAIELVFEGENV